jgi:hypothetical protein
LYVGDGSTWTGGKMPWIWGEFDIGTSVWNEVNPGARSGEGRLRMLHNSTWASLFSPLATSPLDWYWDQEDAATTAARLADRKRTAQFFGGVNYTGAVFALTAADAPGGYTGKTVTASNAKARVFAFETAGGVYAWVQNRDYTWYNSPTTPAAVNATVGIPAASGQYRVSVYDPHAGTWQDFGTLASDGTLNVNVTGLSKDVAIKAIKQ